MADKKYTIIPVDTAIAYTDKELSDCRYSVADALNAAQAISVDRNNSPLRFISRHKERFALVANIKISIAQHNAVVDDVLRHESEYSNAGTAAVIANASAYGARRY